jgi:hypothetical protein
VTGDQARYRHLPQTTCVADEKQKSQNFETNRAKAAIAK